ncbi:radical SAM protein [Candidatus Woesearchaeota archaeon]|nr:radical SAM protein [Candidatus Woesearchaeota archaeon]
MTSENKEDKNEIVLDGHKLMYHQDRVKEWLDGKRIAPITIDMALTQGCNYKCVYCYGQLQDNQGYVLNNKVLSRFAGDVEELGVRGISLISDGESTCSPHFYNFIQDIKSRNIDIAVGTNGVLLKEDKLKEMLSALTYLRFNISAGESKRYAEIMGCKEKDFERIKEIIKESVKIKKANDLEVTIGLQMVLMPSFKDQIIPLTKLGRDLNVDYLVIKHCSDDEDNSLGVDYSKYDNLVDLLKEAETYSTKDYLVKAKWSKILSQGKREYIQCYGPPFMVQISGSGLVAPCGMLFNEKYKKFHIGNIAEKSFKEIWNSDKYWEVMKYIGSENFDARSDCGHLCLQHKLNEYLWGLKKEKTRLNPINPEKKPMHINFV